MDFQLDELELELQRTARDYARKTLAPRARHHDDGHYPTESVAELAALGFMGIKVPERYGGAGMGTLANILALHEIAAACASTAVTMAVTNMVAEMIAVFGTEAQHERYLPAITSGKMIAASFALSEDGAGSDAASLRTTARRDGDHYVIDGSKMWITSGDVAGVLLVMAKTAPELGARGISAFLVEPQWPGFSVGRHEEKMGLRGSSTVSLGFDGLRVPAAALLGNEGDGFKIAMTALDGGRCGIAAQSLGIARAAIEEATRYATERRQFGKAIGEFQAVQWKLADMATRFDAAWLLALRAASEKDRGAKVTKVAAMAKVFATEAASWICEEAVQIHGGYGYTREFAAERHLRDVRVTRIYEGTSEIQRVVIAREVLRGA